MRPDGLCFYHNPEALAKRKPKRLSRKALTAERDRYKAALERILNIRMQDTPLADAWKEARQVAFDAFSS